MLRAERFSLHVLLFCLGCGRGVADEHAREGSAKQELRIPREVVARIEGAQGVTIERAVELAAEDALLAHELARTDPAHARSLATLAHARALLQALHEDVIREAPAQEAELSALAGERWWEFERPRMVRVIHAVVLAAEVNVAAEALASRIREAALGSNSPAEFRKAAEQNAEEGLNVKVETLPPMTQDGRSVDPDDPPPQGPPVLDMAPEFAQAASRLEKKGDVSPVVRSPFGYHVIQLIDVVPPSALDPAERRARLGAEISAERARKKTEELLARLRRELAPEQSRAAVAVMEKVVWRQP